MAEDFKVQNYDPGPPPSMEEGLLKYIMRELRAIGRIIKTINEGLPQVANAPPERPRKGMLAFAVAPWNPGSGDGLYVYNGTAWVKLHA